jgi:hypothetical protein
MSELKPKGIQILTNVDGKELSNADCWPFFGRAKQLGALLMLHPNGFTHGDRFTPFCSRCITWSSALRWRAFPILNYSRCMAAGICRPIRG